MIKFDNSYARLPAGFFEKINPTKVKAPSLVSINRLLCAQLGLDYLLTLSADELAEYFSGNRLLVGSEPIALAYAGHQFANFVPVLGDGRANLLGEIITPQYQRFDMQLKGSGQTAFSRRGDGRSALGPVLREYLLSEFMFRLGVPSSRSLAAVKSGENVVRETLLPGAVLTRIASSHIRIGTFEYFMAKQDLEGIRILADYAIGRHYPNIAEGKDKYLDFFSQVSERQATLVAKWMSVGFIHGVMNTDNVSIAGETLDFGPCALMDYYDPDTVYSYIDKNGRYAYSNQPAITSWNLARLAESMLPLFDVDKDQSISKAKEVLAKFPSLYKTAWLKEFSLKFGIADALDSDFELYEEFLNLLKTHHADFTVSFRALSSELINNEPQILSLFQSYFKADSAMQHWLKKWKARINAIEIDKSLSMMKSVNPIYIARNHLVEQAIKQAYEEQSYQIFEDLLSVLSNPFEWQQGQEKFFKPPETEQQIEYTFCGT